MVYNGEETFIWCINGEETRQGEEIAAMERKRNDIYFSLCAPLYFITIVALDNNRSVYTVNWPSVFTSEGETSNH